MSDRVLIVDDEPSICWALEKALREEGFATTVASSAEDGLKLAQQGPHALVILDVRLPGMDGLEALPRFQAATNQAPVVVITAFGDLDTAVSAVQAGASDYLTKPFKLEDVLSVCRRAVQTRSDVTDDRLVPTHSSAELIGRSAAMQQVFKQIALVADCDLPVLITGETGTGKELVANAIVRHSSRQDHPYLAVAPVTLNPDLMESELFGHIRGAFTGAVEDRKGLFERASGGTVLLDEIGDLPMALQVKLLRVLEQGEFSPVGDDRVLHSDVRIIAATNCDLETAVREGRFREDLYHRLAGMLIHLPPLRARLEDIPLLCQHFLQGMPGNKPINDALSDPLITALSERPWYGNVRELRNATEHAAVVARGRSLEISDFPPPQPSRRDVSDSPTAGPRSVIATWLQAQLSGNTESMSDLHAKFMATFESELVRQVLEATQGNRARAAELLGMHRGTLRERLRSYGDS